jgi:hypothetical protein
MHFSLPCKCGRSVTVTEGAAGTNVPCQCGRSVPVPNLRHLRSQAGLLPQVAPDLINEMIVAGDLPTLQSCVACGARAASFADVGTTWVERSGPARGVWLSFNPLLLVLLNALDFLVVTLATQTKTFQMRLRITLCPDCGQAYRSQPEIEALVRKEPIYSQLLENFPGAKFRMLPIRPAAQEGIQA